MNGPIATPMLRAPTATQAFTSLLVLAEKTARTKLTYRLSALISLLASTLGYGVFLLVWREVYRQGGSALVPKQELFGYLVAAFVLNAVLTVSVEFRFNQRLRTGAITSDLVRPLGFLPFQLAQAAGDVLVNLIFSVPIYALAVLFLGRAALPPDATSLLLGSASGALAFVLNFSISYLIVQASFVLQSIYGVLFTRMALHQVFSGLAAPIALFPAPLAAAAGVLPFRHVIETPVRLWLGQVSGEAAFDLLVSQLIWAALLLALGQGLFHAALKRHQVQGG